MGAIKGTQSLSENLFLNHAMHDMRPKMNHDDTSLMVLVRSLQGVTSSTNVFQAKHSHSRDT